MKQQREIKGIMATVSQRGATGQIILPKSWEGKNIVAILEGAPRKQKITFIASKFGNSCHILLSKEGSVSVFTVILRRDRYEILTAFQR